MLCDYLTIRVKRQYLNNRILRNSKVWFGVINGFPKREPVLPMDGMFDRYLVILFQRMRLKDEADESGERAWLNLCRRLA